MANTFTGTWNDDAKRIAFLAVTDTVADSQFINEYHLTSISMPDVKKIGNNSFDNCGRLTKIEFPNVEEMGDRPFGTSSDAITSIDFPKLKKAGEWALVFKNLTSANLPVLEEIGKNGFYYTKLTTIDLPKIKFFPDSLFENTALTSITAPLLEEIGSSAMAGTKLTTIDLPSLKKVDRYGFGGSYNGLTPIIKLPNLEEIGESAMYGMVNTTVDLPKLRIIGEGGLKGMVLTDTVFPSLETISYQSLSSSKYTDLGKYFPAIKSIDTYAFYSSIFKEIKSDTLEELNGKISSNTSEIASIDIPNIKKIGENAFNGTKLSGIISLPEVEEFTDSGVFEGCDEITGFNFPKLRIMKGLTFYKTSKITRVDLPNLEEIGTSEFGTGPITYWSTPKLHKPTRSTVADSVVNDPSTIAILPDVDEDGNSFDTEQNKKNLFGYNSWDKITYKFISLRTPLFIDSKEVDKILIGGLEVDKFSIAGKEVW